MCQRYLRNLWLEICRRRQAYSVLHYLQGFCNKWLCVLTCLIHQTLKPSCQKCFIMNNISQWNHSQTGSLNNLQITSKSKEPTQKSKWNTYKQTSTIFLILLWEWRISFQSSSRSLQILKSASTKTQKKCRNLTSCCMNMRIYHLRLIVLTSTPK